MWKASVRPHNASALRHSGGNGSASSPARRSASSTKDPISQLVSPTLADAGYTGRMRNVRRPAEAAPATTSTTGFAIWRLPRYSVTFPKKIASVPASSCFARHGWLKKTILRRPDSSRTTTSTTARPVRARRACADCTVASTAASSPTTRSDTSACRVRSM